MTTRILEDYQTLSVTAADEIIAAVKSNPAAVLCLAAGDTPKLAYALLGQKAKNESVSFAGCTFIGLDEWVGIAPENEGTCRHFLYRNLFGPLGIRAAQIHLFDGLAKDLGGECNKMNDVIAGKKGIDLMLVGVGMNGHIGFNEPGTPVESYSHVVDLDSTTQTVGQKYFTQATALRQGITLGLKHFLGSGRGVLVAAGRKKAEVIRQALEGPLTTSMPASIIRRHANGIAILDAEAASLLKV